MTTQSETTVPRPTALVQSAVEALMEQFFEPLNVGTLLTDAWEGATMALVAAGVDAVPPTPAYPGDMAAAVALHEQQFPALEALAESSIGWKSLGLAALRELGVRRRDGHTAFSEPTTMRFIGPFMMATLGLDFGFALSPGPPLRIASVAQGSPAQLAGLHRGLAVLAINGQPVERWHRMAAFGLLEWDEATPSTLRVRGPGGEVYEVTLAPSAAPLLRTSSLGDDVGLLRFDCFPVGVAAEKLVAQLRSALEGFERGGVTGWILDLRWNQGGDSDTSRTVIRMFVNSGRLCRVQSRVELPADDGTLLPLIRDDEANGTALPFQRPLVVLVGPGSSSGAEVCAGSLQALARAQLVGEQTAGWLGGLRRTNLADGWNFSITAAEVLLGPELWRLNRIGLTPDLSVIPTAEDERAGRDPQLEAAIQLLTERNT